MVEFGFWLNSFAALSQGLLHLFFCCRFTGKKINAGYGILYLMLFYAGQMAACRLSSDLMAVVTGLLLLCGMNCCILKNRILVSCVTAVLALYVTQTSFGIISSLEHFLFLFLYQSEMLYLFIAAASLLSVLLSCFCYTLILKQVSLKGDSHTSCVWLLIPPVLFCETAEIYLFYPAYGQGVTVPYSIDMSRHLALMTVQALGLTVLLCVLYAYRHTYNDFRTRASLESLTQEIRAQKIYVTEAQIRYGQTKAFRHDIKNHLTVLAGLLERGKPEQAYRYLQKLEAVTGSLSFPVYTGNPVVDILLDEKMSAARAVGAEMELSLNLMKTCKIEEFDLCVIFSNALDNAIQACMKVEDSKMISIYGERQGDFYMLEFENTCSDETAQAMGTGLSNVKTVAEKYGGAMTVERRPGMFCLNVLLNDTGASLQK